MANMPEYARGNPTIFFKAIVKFHEKVVARLGADKMETLRACAWQIEGYLEQHGKYHDSEFIRTLQHSIEAVANKKSGTPQEWTVEKAKKSLRGRTRGVNQNARKTAPKKTRAPVKRKLSQNITDRLLDIPRREFDEKQS